MSKYSDTARARLQMLIQDWMRDELPEVAPLFEDHHNDSGEFDYRGVAIGQNSVLPASTVSFRASKAALAAIEMHIEIIDMVIGGEE